MNVILTENVKGLGNMGEVVNVKPGYARRHLGQGAFRRFYGYFLSHRTPLENAERIDTKSGKPIPDRLRSAPGWQRPQSSLRRQAAPPAQNARQSSSGTTFCRRRRIGISMPLLQHPVRIVCSQSGKWCGRKPKPCFRIGVSAQDGTRRFVEVRYRPTPARLRGDESGR